MFRALGNDLWHLAALAWQNIWGVAASEFDQPFTLNPSGKSSVIILLHGSSANQNEWKESELHLTKHFTNHPIYAFSLDLEFNSDSGKQVNVYGKYCHSLKSRRLSQTRDASVDDYVKTVNDYVVFLNKQYPGRDMVLIGHSMGGLVAVRYVSQLQPYPMSALVKKVITIASPLQGAPLLNNTVVRRLLNTRRHLDMTPNSKLLSTTHQDLTSLPRKHNLKIYCFASQHDFHVPVSYAGLKVGVAYGINSAVLWENCKTFIDEVQAGTEIFVTKGNASREMDDNDNDIKDN